MKSFQEACTTLASLQTFDPAAFEGDTNVPQRLCNLVLALALIYNDCKNLTHAALLLKDCRPPPSTEKTAVWGTYSGMDRHLFRLMIGLVHELFKLIQDHEDVLTHEFLVKTVRLLPQSSRKSWQSLTAAAIGATPEDEFGIVLLRIRNQTAFHYDPKGIYKGFKREFVGPTRRQDRAYISRGLSMEASRFYFADAAVDGYFREMVGQDQFGEHGQLSTKIRDVTELLNVALLGLVDRFIQQRRFPYRNV